MIKLLSYWLLLTAALVLCACGQKGPLTLPQPSQGSAVAAADAEHSAHSASSSTPQD